jgi:hypothetical protein
VFSKRKREEEGNTDLASMDELPDGRGQYPAVWSFFVTRQGRSVVAVHPTLSIAIDGWASNIRVEGVGVDVKLVL